MATGGFKRASELVAGDVVSGEKNEAWNEPRTVVSNTQSDDETWFDLVFDDGYVWDYQIDDELNDKRFKVKRG